MMNQINDLGIEITLLYEDERYPDLIIQSEKFGTVGYSLNLDNGELRRICICGAMEEDTCVCGYDDYA